MRDVVSHAGAPRVTNLHTSLHSLILAALDDELERHHRAAFGWALACCRWDREVAEDVLQAAYLKVIDGRAVFAGRSDFRTFLFAVIRRTAREERRRSVIRAAAWMKWLRVTPPDTTTPAVSVDALVRAETSRELLAALDRLSARQRGLLYLVFFEGLTIKASAEALGISVGSAHVHYARGKAQLRQYLEDGRNNDG